MTNLDSLYPMIHQDKLIYKYQNKIRIGTDDNDVVEINSSSSYLFDLLKAMNGNHNIQYLYERFNNFLTKNELLNLILKLIQSDTLSILKKPFNSLEGKKYKSDLIYYYSEGFDGNRVLNCLKNMHITILGVGGGGSLIALQLANLGVGNIRIVDDDVVDSPNLNRQFLFTESDIGKYKVDVLKERLLERNYSLNIKTKKKRINTIKDALEELSDSDWCFCCIDEPPYIAQRIVNKACYIKKIPSIYGFSARDSAKLVIVDPDKTGCIDCLLTSRDNIFFQKLIQAFKESDFSPSTPIIISNMMLETSWMVKKWLDVVVGKAKIESKLFRFDYNDLKEEEFVKFDHTDCCPTCGKRENNSKLWQIIPIK